MARGNAGAAGDGGQSRSRLRFDCQLRFAVARIRSVRELGPSFYRARFTQRGRSVLCFGVRFCGKAFGRALGHAVLNDDAGAFVRSFGR